MTAVDHRLPLATAAPSRDTADRRRVGRALVHRLDRQAAVDAICGLASDPRRGHLVVTPNAQHITLLDHDRAFRAAYDRASLVLADGWPVARAARTERVPGSDLFPVLCAEAARRGLTVGVVGGRGPSAALAVARLRVEHPDLQVTVVDVPAYGFERSPEQVAQVVRRVSRARPDILFLALGAPKQEVFAAAHAEALGAGVIVCVGAAVDFYAGTVRRAPVPVQRAGFEWAHRVVQEPRRLAGRYLRCGPAFLRAVFGTKPRPVAGWLRSYAAALVLCDAVVLLTATLLASHLRFGATADQQPYQYSVVSLMLAGGWLGSLALTRAYDRRFLGAGSEEFRRVFHASLYCTAAVGFASFALHADLARGFLGLSQLLGTAGLLVERHLLRTAVARRRRRGQCLHRVVVVGDPDEVAQFAGLVGRDVGAGFRVVGVVTPHAAAAPLPDVPTYHSLSDVALAVDQQGADTVAVTGSGSVTREVVRSISWSLERSGVSFMVAPALTDVAGPRLSVRPVAGLPLLHVEQPEFSGSRRLLKAALERTAALVALVLLAPLWLAMAAAVRLGSPGPAFFRQVRVGRDGRRFTMLKFRTMVDGAHALRPGDNDADPTGPLFKLRDDPRVTRVGRLLRRWSLDELPQLWNVVRGEMALVGPRPPLPSEVDVYGDDVGRRLLVTPGMTGLWQVNGRADLAWDESVRLDLYYVENWSLALDLSILAKTFGAIVRRQGAY